MNDRAYDRMANILMLVAVASALMFDSGILPHIVVGAIGGIAAIGSASLYFNNQRRMKITAAEDKQSTKSVASVEEKITTAAKMMAGTSFASPAAPDLELAKQYAEKWVVMGSAKHYVGHAYAHHYNRHVNSKLAARGFYGGILVYEDLAGTDPVLSPQDVAACTIEIIQQLSTRDEDDRWEFHFGANGLRVSAKKGHASPERISPQRDLDFFGQMPTTTIQ